MKKKGKRRPRAGKSSALGFSEPVLAFIKDASLRLSLPVNRLKIAVAAAGLGPETFGIIETLVAAKQDQATKQRLEDSAGAISKALDTVLSSKKDPLAEIDEKISRQEVIVGQILAEQQSRRLQERLLEDCVSVDDAALLTGRSRQALEKRRRDGRLLAVKVKNQWRYPKWQFDVNSPGGVVPGLAEVLAQLSLTPVGAAAWLTQPSGTPEEKAPIELLRDGKTGDVVELAEEVGHLL